MQSMMQHRFKFSASDTHTVNSSDMHEHAGCKPFPSIRTTSFCSSAFRFCEQEELWQPLTNDGAKHRHSPTGTQRFFSRDATRQRPGRRGRLKSLRRFRFGGPCTHGSCAGRDQRCRGGELVPAATGPGLRNLPVLPALRVRGQQTDRWSRRPRGMEEEEKNKRQRRRRMAGRG